MLDFHCEYIDLKLNTTQGILQTFMLAPLLFTKKFFRYGNKKGIEQQSFYVRVYIIYGSSFRILLFINEVEIEDIIC